MYAFAGAIAKLPHLILILSLRPQPISNPNRGLYRYFKFSAIENFCDSARLTLYMPKYCVFSLTGAICHGPAGADKFYTCKVGKFAGSIERPKAMCFSFWGTSRFWRPGQALPLDPTGGSVPSPAISSRSARLSSSIDQILNTRLYMPLFVKHFINLLLNQKAGQSSFIRQYVSISRPSTEVIILSVSNTARPEWVSEYAAGAYTTLDNVVHRR